MKNLIKAVYLEKHFFTGMGIVITSFFLSFFFPSLYLIAWGIFIAFTSLVLYTLLLLFPRNNSNFIASRQLPERLSNGDENAVYLQLKSNYNFTTYCKIIDEVPFQFQQRDFFLEQQLLPKEKKTLSYPLYPKERGEYSFGYIHIFVSTKLALLSRRFSFDNKEMRSCYPSFIQMKKYDLMAFSNNKSLYGIKKIRRIGQTNEFEQIKEYVLGDDIRTINWKATAKANQLMVNQFQDEQTEAVYCIIDKGRTMQMPFNGLSLLDYAINSTLALSNVILKKKDRVGLMTFSNALNNHLVANNKNKQLQTVIEQLYNVSTDYHESDFGLLYTAVKYKVKQRSLLLLFTNFESLSALKRQLPYLRSIAKHHRLIVVFFTNTELDKLAHRKAKKIDDIFDKILAEKLIFEKKLIVSELTKYGIQTVLSAPEDLSIKTINKYLQIKAQGIV